MARDSLLIAEQRVDLQTRPYLFRGREIESVTGRILLHAIDGAGRPLCGRDRADLTLTEQPWQAGYLPHLPRCHDCAAADGQPDQGSDLPGPDPPPHPAGGADARSTWTHLSVCALEYQSLAQILGVAAAEAELSQHEGYSWIYEQILAEPEWFSGLLRSQGIEVPTQPPVPRRYFGDPGWERADADVGPPGDLV